MCNLNTAEISSRMWLLVHILCDAHNMMLLRTCGGACSKQMKHMLFVSAKNKVSINYILTMLVMESSVPTSGQRTTSSLKNLLKARKDLHKTLKSLIDPLEGLLKQPILVYSKIFMQF